MADTAPFLYTPLAAACTTLQPLQAVFKQPTWVLSMGLSAEARASASGTSHPCNTYCSRCTSPAKKCRDVAQTLCAGLSLVCLLQVGCHILLLASEAPFLTCLVSLPMQGLPRVRKPFHFSYLPPRDTGLIPPPPFIFPGYMVIFLAILVLWDLPESSTYSVRIVPHVDVFLMYLWERMRSISFYSAVMMWLLTFPLEAS